MKISIREAMCQIIEDLQLKLSPANNNLVSYKLSSCGGKAKIRAHDWTLHLKISSTCIFDGEYVVDPKVVWSLTCNGFEDLSSLDRLACLMEELA